MTASSITIIIDWGDGNTETVTGAITKEHTYSTPGKYEITIQNNITNSNKWNFQDIGSSYYFRHEMIDEILFDSKVTISTYSLKYVNAKISIPVGSLPTIGAGTFQYSDIPIVVIPNGCGGTSSTICFSTFTGKISLPRSMPSSSVFTSTFFGSTVKRLVISEQPNNDFTNVYFQNATVLEIISIPLNFGIASNGTSVFNYSAKLRRIDIVQGWIPNNNLTLSGSTFWSQDSIVDFFNKLGDRSSESTPLTLTFGSTNLAKLTQAQKDIATNKGYTLA